MIRSFQANQLDVAELADRKDGRTISVCLPARNEQATVGAIVTAVRSQLVDGAALVDEVLVLDDHSTDGTAAAAAEAGARVVAAADVASDLERGPGKGTAMWKSLAVAEGDLVVWCDADIIDFDPSFVVGLVGPLLLHADLLFVKGFYERPLEGQLDGGGRVTELMARPVLSLLFPELAAIIQPLAGEYAGRREALAQMSFAPDYGVDIGLLIDLTERFGLGAIAQCDLGVRRHRNRTLDELGAQAAAVLLAALRRADPKLVVGEPRLVRPGHPPIPMEDADLPPLAAMA